MSLATTIVAAHAHAEQPYLDQNRIGYIAKAFKAFDATKAQRLANTANYISAIDANNCRSNFSDLRARCLLSYAKKNCGDLRNKNNRQRCELYSDIIVANKMSEATFISITERYRISRISGYDFKTALENRLRQKYARIVTTFSLGEGANCKDKDFDCLAKGLDQFCLDYTNSQSLSWQYCVSASVWFIGTAGKQ